MRFYSFTNLYISSIQNGIQSAHCVADMFIKYNDTSKQSKLLHEWAENHKTMIVLNGGYSETLRQLNQLFTHTKNPYPFCKFHEGNEALDGALTCVGIVLPEKIYQTSAIARKSSNDVYKEIKHTNEITVGSADNASGFPVTWKLSYWECKLIEELNKYSLAN